MITRWERCVRINYMHDEIVIDAGGKPHYWSDLWRYRELFRVLAWRDLSVRYKQTVIGVLWALIRPFLTMVVLTIIFSRIARLPTDGNAPYALMVFAGTLPWILVSTGLSEASDSLISNANLISKVYFPRSDRAGRHNRGSVRGFPHQFLHFTRAHELVPVHAGLADGCFTALRIMGFLPVSVHLFGLAALNVKYRDFRYVIPFIVQFGLYLSPVGFSSSVVPEHWRLLYSLNPMVGVIDGFRWCILRGQSDLYPPSLCGRHCHDCSVSLVRGASVPKDRR